MVKQNRRFARVHWMIACYYIQSGTDKPGEQYGWGTLRNISVEGAELATRFPIAFNEPLFLTFNVGAQYKFVNVRAKLVHMKTEWPYHIGGLHFESDVDHAQIESAIAFLLNPD